MLPVLTLDFDIKPIIQLVEKTRREVDSLVRKHVVKEVVVSSRILSYSQGR